MIRAAFLLGFLLVGPSFAQTPQETARNAAAMIEGAAQMLADAGSGRDRVSALTETVRSYETGLAALREGMRQAAAREAAIGLDIKAREADISALLGVLQSLSNAPAPARLIHPEGPAGTARAGMLLADVTPGLQAEVLSLRARLDELQLLQSLQEQSAALLETGLLGAQDARTALSQAVADRSDLPARFADDPEMMAVLLAASETMDAFARALSSVPLLPDAQKGDFFAAQRGAVPLPVSGRVLRRAGEQDAAGVTRPGILVATEGNALVTAPVPATLRYQGPLLNYGLVSILEPAQDVFFVFAGLAQAFGTPGQVLPAGDPVGLMGAPANDGSQSGEGGGNTLPETLYIEVRENGAPVDPAIWFRM